MIAGGYRLVTKARFPVLLGLHFQLRPTAQKSLCEWLDENAVQDEENQDCEIVVFGGGVYCLHLECCLFVLSFLVVIC